MQSHLAENLHTLEIADDINFRRVLFAKATIIRVLKKGGGGVLERGSKENWVG